MLLDVKALKCTFCLIAFLAIAFVLPRAYANAAERPPRRPNIVIMMVDDMGYAGPSIAPYGNSNYKTPGMDRLAREGLRFSDFHASGAICSATRAGLLTGRYQQRAGIEAVIHPRSDHPEHRKGLHESEVTFAELFQQAGYATGLVGKWHLGYAEETPKYHPLDHGFDYFKGYVSGNIDYVNHWGDHFRHDWWHGRKLTTEQGYTTHLINRYAIEFIEANRDRPFCLYVAHESPHAPVQGPNDPIQRGPGAQKRTTPANEAMKQMILEMDKGVEQVRAKLVELGLAEHTLFLFFSDNGDARGTNTGSPKLRGHKGSVYEGGTRVPAIAWWPGRIEAGKQTDATAISIDIMPTVLSAAGIAAPRSRSLDGVDLMPVLLEQKPLPPRTLYWANLSNNGARSEAIRDGDWKLVVQHRKAKPGTFANESIELFQLKEDLAETSNLAVKHPERASQMLQRLKAWYADTQRTASPQPGGWLAANNRPQTNKPPQANGEEGFVSIFDGRTLNGWRPSTKEGRGAWKAQNGVLIGNGDGGRGYLIYSKNEQLADFDFRFEYRFPGKGNSGVSVRALPDPTKRRDFQSYHADLGHVGIGKQILGAWDFHTPGRTEHQCFRGDRLVISENDKPTLTAIANGVKDSDIRKGNWNRARVVVHGNHFQFFINGKLSSEFIENLPKERRLKAGMLQLQVHDPNMKVHFRHMRLKVLN